MAGKTSSKQIRKTSSKTIRKTRRKRSKRSLEEKQMRRLEQIVKKREGGKYEQRMNEEFAEIRKILAEDPLTKTPEIPEMPYLEELKKIVCKPTAIPIDSLGITVFEDDASFFSLFNKDSLKLKNFIDPEKEFPKIFGDNDSIPSEDCFRQLIALGVADTFDSDEEEGCPSTDPIGLYVLYLMSVHDKSSFVDACYEFLVSRPFRLESKHIIPILLNFGAKFGDDCPYECDTDLLKKLSGINESSKKEDSEEEKKEEGEMKEEEKKKEEEEKKGGKRKGGKRKKEEEKKKKEEEEKKKKEEERKKKKEEARKKKFPVYNITMVGKILVHFVTGNHIAVDSETKTLLKVLVKITLDPKVKSESMLPVFTMLVPSFCTRIVKEIGFKEVLDWLYFRNEHLLLQVEICRVVSKIFCPDLHYTLLMGIIYSIIRPINGPLKETVPVIHHIKAILKEMSRIRLPPLEEYAVYVLINSTVRCVEASVYDVAEICSILDVLENTLDMTIDAVDLLGIRVELAKMRSFSLDLVPNYYFVTGFWRALTAKKL